MKTTITYALPMSLALVFALAGPVQAACEGQHVLGASGALANEKPDSLYTDNGDGTVTDKETGLMWTKCALPMDYVAQQGGGMGCDTSVGATEYTSWAHAMNATEAANDDDQFGYDDWRLPNIKELASLADLACNGSTAFGTGALNTDVFDLTVIKMVGGTPDSQYPSFLWSASTNINVQAEVRGMSVVDGALPMLHKTNSAAAVMLVRNVD